LKEKSLFFYFAEERKKRVPGVVGTEGVIKGARRMVNPWMITLVDVRPIYHRYLWCGAEAKYRMGLFP